MPATQLTIASLASSVINASPSGLSRTSNVVTCNLTSPNQSGFAPIALSGYTTTYPLVVVTGSTAVLGNDFDGSFIATSVNGTQSVITWIQDGPDDTGGGGVIFALPYFTDIPDSIFAGGNTLSNAALTWLSRNTKFGAVRVEALTMGYFVSGNVIPAPTSPVDGYIYSPLECLMISIPFSSRAPSGGFTPGQLTPPTLSGSDVGTGQLIADPYQNFIDPDTLQLTLSYYFSTSGVALQGTSLVRAYAQRLSVKA